MKVRQRSDLILIYCDYAQREIVKSIRARWNARAKCWDLPKSIVSYSQVIEMGKTNGIKLDIDPTLVDWYEKANQALKSYGATKEYKTKQFKHQVPMTNLILNKKKCFIFAGVGTGKTKSAIDAVTNLYDQGKVKKVLVVSPASIMWNFKNEIKIHSHLDATVVYGSLQKRRKILSDSNTVFDIINYEMLSKLMKEIKANEYEMVIFDEIHYCKSRQSARSKAAYDVAKNCQYRVGLSGTIISNSYEDLFMPYKVIDETIFGPHFTRFKDRYFIVTNWSGYDEVVGYKFENEIKKLIATNSIKFEIRDVIDSLPPENNIVKSVNLEDKSLKAYKDLKRDMILEYDNKEIIASNVLERMMRLSQITSGFIRDKETEKNIYIGNEKLSYLKELIQDINEKCVVFCRFRSSIDRVVELCDSLGISYYVYDGRTKEKDLYIKFNNDNTKIFIAQIQKSEGYSIPSARYCIFYELDYSRKNHIQSRGRILRASGSEHSSIFYIYLLAQNTIDEVIYKTLKEKDFTSKQALEMVRGMESL